MGLDLRRERDTCPFSSIQSDSIQNLPPSRLASFTNRVGKMSGRFNVGGISLDRPFKVRRLGHFGLNLTNFDACLSFLRDDLGFIVSDHTDVKKALPGRYDDLADTEVYFLRYGTDHHAIVLASVEVAKRSEASFGPFDPKVTLNQATWQVGSLREVVDAGHWIKSQGITLVRSGRDMPGSNWHAYFPDPDGRVTELYFGMEQVGWDGLSKPQSQYHRGFRHAPELPQPSEAVEIDAIRGSAEMWAGHVGRPTGAPGFDVDGVLLPRPFKVVGLGPLKLFCTDLEATSKFYRDVLGFTLTSTELVEGQRCLFLRAGTDHHAVALLPMSLRTAFGMPGEDNLCAIGIRVANYRQLRDARTYLAGRGYRELRLPASLSPGVDHCFHVLDPDGRVFQLFWHMETLGWDGRARPDDIALHPSDDWPETLAPWLDLHGNEPFLGPWE